MRRVVEVAKYIKCKYIACVKSKQDTSNKYKGHSKKNKRGERDYCKEHWYIQKRLSKWS